MPRIVDVVFGFTVLSSLALSLMRGSAGADARIVVVLLHALVGVLFVCRRAAIRESGWRDRLVSLGSVPLPMVALWLAPPIDTWPVATQAIFVLGGGFTALSLATLGRSFAVLPADRGIVTRGPFMWVRHPVYAGEIVMVTATVVSRPAWLSAALLGLTVALVVARIAAEERLLGAQAAYGAYAGRVRYRLLPLLW